MFVFFEEFNVIPFLSWRGIRQHQQVAIIAHSRAAEVRTSKSVHRAIRKVVTTASVPTIVTCIWAQLYHPKGRLCTWMGVAVATSSDKWIDIFYRGPLSILSRKLKPDEQGE